MLLGKTKPLSRLLRRFGKSRKGATAVEFAMIILPFLLIVMGTLEIALIHLARSSMADALDRSSRQIMTGGGSCYTPATYITALCDKMTFSIGDCEANTKVEMQELAAFTSAVTSANLDFDNVTSTMSNGQGNSVMLLRSYYRWNVMFPLLDTALGGDDGEVLLISNVAFRNEPFNASQGCTPATT